MKNKPRSADFWLILFAVLIAFAMLFAGKIISKPGSIVEIRLRGEVYATLPLSRDAALDVEGLCLVKISDGKALVESAVCKNQICVKHPPISLCGQTVVCLPSEVTLKVLGDGADFYI